MSIERIKLSELKKIRDEEDIEGYFTSVEGEYDLPERGKTAFYKESGHTMDAHNDEDLREMLSSQILDIVEIPHADIVPVYDDIENSNGCLSVNILGENEEFRRPPKVSYNDPKTAKEFIENDLVEISGLPGITQDMIENRRSYLARMLFTSALLSNVDVSADNSQMIYNKQTGKYRNPEAYDFGLSFVPSSRRKMFLEECPEDVLEYLYENYSSDILTYAIQTEKNLTSEKVSELLSDPIYDGFDNLTRTEILTGMSRRIDLIKEKNRDIAEKKESEKPVISTKDIYSKVKGSKVSLKDKISNFISNLKNKIIGRDNRDDSNRD